MTELVLQPLTDYRQRSEAEMKTRASEFYIEMKHRRSVRDFSDQPVDRGIIEDCLRTAACAPSGANQQPWRFVVVSNTKAKQQIRAAAETVEHSFYNKMATAKWRDNLKHLNTDASKPFLETAPYLICIFSERHGVSPTREKITHYYVSESVGIATGMLITALHHVGLCTLTYTPVDMRFLNGILLRPANEKPFMILVVGYPAADAMVPALQKKALEDVVEFV
jgi:iodotyrosine deiodinase